MGLLPDRLLPQVHLRWLAITAVLAALPSAGRCAELFRAFNLGGPQLTIDGVEWAAGDASPLHTSLQRFEQQQVPLLPAASEPLATMLRSSVYDPGGKNRVELRGLQPGVYSVVLYSWEDNNSTTYDIHLNGKPVLAQHRSGAAGQWHRLGPWITGVQDGTLVLTSVGGHANWSGLEVWRGEYSGVSPEDERFFEQRIRPVLAGTCQQCHGSQTSESGLRVDRLAYLKTGGDAGPAIVPGDVDASLLIDAIRRSEEHVAAMPPDEPLDEQTVRDFEEWVRRGSPWPFENRVTVLANRDSQESDHWAFQPIASVVPPTTDGGSRGPASPVDAFLDDSLSREGLQAWPAADRRTLIRRVAYDLTGLPPSDEDVQRFVSDASPDAFRRLVDRMLADPAYGEKWGRHWLDLVRYADTAGDNSDFPIPQAHLYRDYVIAALNEDLPYDEFLRQQISGDLLPAETAVERDRGKIATGYIAISRRFGSIIDGYPQHLTIEDTIDNLGRTMLGLTVGCSRCHDHKFDPISQADYYALYGIFDSTRYPFPGIELDQKPRDFIALESRGEGADAYAVTDAEPHDVRIHISGNPEKLGDQVARGFIATLGGGDVGPAAAEASGRVELGRWLTDPTNPLPARVMVNRIWQYHFGQGIVTTPSDFGTRGSPPSHPELLDWLASRFVDSGWSTKAMHRTVMFSDAYRRASATPDGFDEHLARNLNRDPGNQLLWRFNRRRMTAEELRDSLMLLAGRLDRSLPDGPHPFPPEDEWKFTQHYPFDEFYETPHRSVYMMTRRLKRHPFFAVFDGPDRNATTPVRGAATTTLQALFMMNAPMIHEDAERIAARLCAAGPGADARIETAFQWLYCRQPEPTEMAAVKAALDDRFLSTAAGEETLSSDTAAWAAVIRACLRTNRFSYID